MLRDKRLEDERSEVADLFRLRFRIPFLLFRDVFLPTFREKKIFSDQGNHRLRVSLEFKILASLRILGRGNCVDGADYQAGVLCGPNEATCFT